MGLIGISGKIGSGKDTVGRIIHRIIDYFDCEHFDTYEEAREAAILEAIKLVKEKTNE